MATTEEVEAFFANGDRSFAEASAEIQQDLARLLRPASGKGFSVSARDWLKNRWLLLPASRVAEIESFNASRTNKIGWRTTIAGERLIPLDLLTDCRGGETYGSIRSLLLTLKVKIALPDEFPPSVGMFDRPEIGDGAAP